jgi:hypothetical protein
MSDDVSDVEAAAKQQGRRADRKVKPVARSRVGNGKVLLTGIDTHSREYREYRDAVADLVEHLGSNPTAVQRAIVEEAAGLIVWCRNARLALLKGEDFDVGKYTTATNSLRRLLADIGQERKLKDITPDLHSYLKQKAARDASKSSAGLSDDGAQE